MLLCRKPQLQNVFVTKPEGVTSERLISQRWSNEPAESVKFLVQPAATSRPKIASEPVNNVENVFITVSCTQLWAKQDKTTCFWENWDAGIITESKGMSWHYSSTKMFSCQINTLLRVHWINKPFIIVVSLLLCFLQSFHTAGRKSMTPFTAATMSSKSGASLICNALLLIFAEAPVVPY